MSDNQYHLQDRACLALSNLVSNVKKSPDGNGKIWDDRGHTIGWHGF
jgi:hypothetical protein